jgi:hypothetical protein
MTIMFSVIYILHGCNLVVFTFEYLKFYDFILDVYFDIAVFLKIGLVFEPRKGKILYFACSKNK